MTGLPVPICCSGKMVLKAVNNGIIFYQCNKCLSVEMIG